jgi:hypothetical protein
MNASKFTPGPVLEISTPHKGRAYLIHANGYIQRADMPHTPGPGWQLLGLQHVKRAEFVPVAELLAGKIPAPLLYDNGRPQWTGRDLDHGTTREWGNTHSHGVSSVRVLRAVPGLVFTTHKELSDVKHGPGVFFVCGRCGEVLPVQTEGGTGYAYETENGPPVCYACCGEIDRARMIETGRAVLYLTHNRASGNYSNTFGQYVDGKVSNWPGTLNFPARVRIGRHNIAGRRYDVWFNGPDGYEWHGVQYGDNSQLTHSKRTKTKSKLAQ